ncbi:NAD-dependent epimerase/dehydratase family protein [Glutamicibacter sp. NPDC087831]|uniref:NAD-dependent epimerase/dehydratase family protein n=1 Tax=Glutamicibacter sp. NPDC087831 TaxID=3363998 RepID=UPI0037F84AD9
MKRTLILGGTAWLGRELARQLIRSGHEVTCLARGNSGEVAQGAQLVRADRSQPGAYEAVQGIEFDSVIELSYEPQWVHEALAALAATARHWTLVSSISVYASSQLPGAGEDAQLHDPSDPGDYGHAKVLAERASTAMVADRLLIARPGLLAGPGDPSDRFSYWVSRLALAGAGQVLIPPTAGRHVQVIDVRDAVAWIIDAAARSLTGTFNVAGTSHGFAQFLSTAARIAGFSGELVTAQDAWLRERQVNYWAGARSLPLWLALEDHGFAQRSNQRYALAGGPERDLEDLLGDVLADERARGLDRSRRAGLGRAEELELLGQLGRIRQG